MNEQDGLKSFLQLNEHGKPNDFAIRSPRRGVIDLMTYADAKGLLEVAGPWRMSPTEARAMEDTLGWAPSGGWASLAALLCGTGALVATHHGFYPKQTVREWQERDDSEVRILLAEAFAKYLVPPAPMAGLCVALAVDPRWGLRVAKVQGRAGGEVFEETSANRAFPDEALEVAQNVFFGSLAGIFAGLAQLESGQAYPVDLFGEFCRSCLKTAWTMGQVVWDVGSEALPLFDTQGPRWQDPGALDMLVDDILDDVLVPAGVASRVEVGRFVVHDDLAQVDVGLFTRNETLAWLGWVTATEPRFLVA